MLELYNNHFSENSDTCSKNIISMPSKCAACAKNYTATQWSQIECKFKQTLFTDTFLTLTKTIRPLLVQK